MHVSKAKAQSEPLILQGRVRAGCGCGARCCWIAGQSLGSQTGGTTNLVGQARLVTCQNRNSDRQCGSKFAFEFIQSSVWVIIKTQIGPTTATGGERRETFPQTILVQPQRIFIHRSTDPGATTQRSRSIQDPSVQPRAEPQPLHEKPEKWNVASACLQSESGPSRRRTISMERSSNNDVHCGQRRTSDRQLLR